MKIAKKCNKSELYFEKKKVILSFISHNTQLNKLKTERWSNNIKNLHLVSQQTLDMPKTYWNQQKRVKPVYKENISFCSKNHWMLL